MVMNEERTGGRTGEPAFRFEAGWVQEEHCKTIVNNAWKLRMDVRPDSVVDAIHEVGAELWAGAVTS